MADNYSSFKTFNDKETAEDFSEVLKEYGIDFFIEEDVLEFDPTYANNALDKDFHIMVKQQDFGKAKQAYEAYFKKGLQNAPPDYYLFSFSENELKEIMAKPDEWGTFDYLLAEKILHDRGIGITETEKQELKTERYKQLQEEQKEKLSNILLYYIFCLIIFPIGILIGWAWAYSKKTLPDGKKVPAYDSDTQRHGKIIFILAVILFVLTILWKVVGPIS
jgi:hypothetical protein